MPEITEVQSRQFEQSADITRMRMVKAFPQLRDHVALYRAATESIGTEIYTDPDGDPVPEYWKPGMVPGAAFIKPTSA